MREFFLTLCLMLGFVVTANSQFVSSETTRKAQDRLTQGDRAGAIAILDKAIEKHKDLLGAYQMRARLRSMTGDLDGAISDYSAAIEINPNNPTIYERRARFRLFRRDYAGALKDFDAAIASGLKTEDLYSWRAAVKRDMGDMEGAIADYKISLGINPSFASAHNGLAITLERKGDIDSAILDLQQFLDGYEGTRDGKGPKIKGEKSSGVSISIKRDGKEKDGSQVVMTGEEIAVPFKANSPEEMEKQNAKYEQLINLSLAYANLGRLYAQKNDFDRALEAYEKGLSIRKGDSYIHKLRSEIRIKRGDLQGATADLEVVANSAYRSPDRHFDKGILFVLQGKDAEAEKEFALHMQMFPQASEFRDKRIQEARQLRSQQPQQ